MSQRHTRWRYIAAPLLALVAGCKALPPNQAIRVEDHSIGYAWQQAGDVPAAWERVAVTPPVTAHALRQPPAVPQVYAAPAAPVTAYPPAQTPRPTLPSVTPQRPPAPPAKALPPKVIAAPRPTAHQAQAPAPAMPVRSSRERELTLRYANGDVEAAVELAQLLFAQGRDEAGDMVLDYAARKGHPQAIQLKAQRQHQ